MITRSQVRIGKKHTLKFSSQRDIAITEANAAQEYMSVWWQNTRSKEVGGLRLTDKGFPHPTEKLDIQSMTFFPR